MNYEEFDALALQVEQTILAEAATWETEFASGSGQVVSVSDAARVVAKMLNFPLPALATGGLVGPESFDEAHRVLGNSPCAAEVFTPRKPKRRLRACVEAWPECEEGNYNPSCCRFPKSCSATVYDSSRVKESDLEVIDRG